MFSFKIFLLFRVRVAGEKVIEKEDILARERQFQQLVLVLAKYGKINNAQVAVSAVTAVLKKAIPVVRKSCDSYHEKSCDSYHEKSCPSCQESCLLQAEANDVRWVILDCWSGHLAFTLWIWLKNGKISLKDIVLFWV